MKNGLMKKVAAFCLIGVMMVSFAACSAACTSEREESEDRTEETGENAEDTEDAADEDVITPVENNLEDGLYTVDFSTDSSNFRVNEIYEGKGTMIVSEGAMTIHIVMASQDMISLFQGTAEDAQKDGADLIYPDLETVTDEDGTQEDVYAFDLSVPVIDEEFDIALMEADGTWSDHKAVVSNPVSQD